jgi:hypothetical protein
MLPTLLGILKRANLNHWKVALSIVPNKVGVSFPSYEGGNRWSFQRVVLSSYSGYQPMAKVQTPSNSESIHTARNGINKDWAKEGHMIYSNYHADLHILDWHENIVSFLSAFPLLAIMLKYYSSKDQAIKVLFYVKVSFHLRAHEIQNIPTTEYFVQGRNGQSSWLQNQRSQVRFLALQHFLSNSGSGTGSTRPCEDKCGAT